jgi:hypothetical protein
MSRFPLLSAVSLLMVLSSSAASGQAPIAGSLPPARFHRAGAALASPSTPLAFAVGVRVVADHPFAGSGQLGVGPTRASNSPAAQEAIADFWISRRRHAPGVALMIVGAAGVITGLLIDESIITLAGAGAGLIGLYLYLR